MNWIPLLSTLLHYFDGNVSRHSSLLSPRSLRICLITYCHKRGSREQQLQIVIAIDPLLNFCRDWAPGKIYLGMFRQDNENGVHLGSFKARYELLYLFPLLRGLTVPLKGIPESLAWRHSPPSCRKQLSNYSIISCLQNGIHAYENPFDDAPSFCEDDQCYDSIDDLIPRPLLADGAVGNLPLTEI